MGCPRPNSLYASIKLIIFYNMFSSIKKRVANEQEEQNSLPRSLRTHSRRAQVINQLQSVQRENMFSENKVKAELERLAMETENYEKRLKVVRDQLRQRQSQNEQIYKAKVQMMVEQFQILKQNFDFFKLGIYLAKTDIVLKYRVFFELQRRCLRRKAEKLKRQYLQKRLLKNYLQPLFHDKPIQKDSRLPEHKYDMKLAYKVLNVLKRNWQRANINKLRNLIAGHKPKVVQVQIKPNQNKPCLAFNDTIKPIKVFRERIKQIRQKIKVVKRPAKRNPKVHKKAQKIIFKQPSVSSLPPQLVTLHIKLQENQSQHQHVECKKKQCSTHHTPQKLRKAESPKKGEGAKDFRQKIQTKGITFEPVSPIGSKTDIPRFSKQIASEIQIQSPEKETRHRVISRVERLRNSIIQSSRKTKLQELESELERLQKMVSER